MFANDALKMLLSGQTSQFNVKSNACYTMMSIFAKGPVTSISKCNVLTAHTHENCHINTWLSFH